MRKFTFLKSLLVAAMLMGGANYAWAEKEWQLAWADYFEDAAKYTTNMSWSSTNNLTIGQAERPDGVSGKYYYVYDNGANGRMWTFTIGNAYEANETSWSKYTYKSDEAYKLEFDIAFRSDRFNNNYGSDQSFTIPNLVTMSLPKASTTATFTAINAYAAGSISAGDNLFTISAVYDYSNTGNVFGNHFYHFIIEGRSTGTKLTVYGPYTTGAYPTSPIYNATLSDSKVDLANLTGTVQRYYSSMGLDNVQLYKEIEAGTVELPTYSITAANGVQREVALSCITDGAVIKYNTVNDKSASGWTTYSAPFYTSEATLYAYSEKDSNTSDVITITTGAGSAITLNAPTITEAFIANGLVYNPRYTFSSNQSGKVIGNPTLTYTYSFNSGASTEGTSYSPASNGSLTVTVSADGYTSNSTTQDVFGGNFARTYFFDAINDVTVDTGSGTWGNGTNINSTGWSFTDMANCTYTLRGDISLTGFMYARATTAQTKQGLYTRLSDGSIGFTLVDGEAIVFTTLGDDIIAHSSSTSQAIGKYTNIRTISVYSPATEADIAILDCKQHETSAAFATAVAAESFSTAAEVYNFHTAWQIAQADAASSNDITKVIFDAGVSDFTRWNNARSNQNQQYTGAPDNKYFDAWDSQVSDARQTIHGLPAGTYTLVVATRASNTLSDKSKYNVWVNGGSADASVLGNHIGNSGGCLGNGWDWTVIPFTLDAQADVTIGFYSLPGNGTGLWAGADDWHLYQGTLSVSGTITPAGWASFASAYPLDLSTISGGTVYYASASESNTVSLTSTTEKVAAGEGLMIKGTAGETFTINVTGDAPTFSGTNLLKGQTTTGNVAASDGTTQHYVFGYKNTDATEYGFYNLTSATEIPAGKAYLETTGGATKLRIVFDEATAIETVENSQAVNGKYYDLQGRLVAQPTKGLYIVNGKKVFIK